MLASCLGSRDRFVNRLGDERVGQEGLGLAAEALRATQPDPTPST